MEEQALHKQFNTHCEPLFILDAFLKAGHSELTENGTLTYVSLDGQVYGVTCRHVVEGAEELSNKNGTRLNLAVMYQRTCSFFRRIDPATGQFVSSFAFPKTDDDRLDVAIHAFGADMPPMQTRKGKQPIDLDAWQQPAWSTVKLGAAIGYGSEHKSRLGDKVQAPMHVVTASLSSTVYPASRQLVFSDQLAAPHGTFFSGMSGGPIFVDDGTEAPKFAGIVYEGAPGSSKAWEARNLEQAFIDERDIVIYGVPVTPDIFREWVANCSF